MPLPGAVFSAAAELLTQLLAADEQRLTKLRAAGFVVAAVTDTDVWQHPAKVVAVVRDGRTTARLNLLDAA